MVSIFSRDLLWYQEKIKGIPMQNFGGTKKEYYGIFLNWPIRARICALVLAKTTVALRLSVH